MRRDGLLRHLTLALASLIFTTAAIELGGRAVGYDFGGLQQQHEAWPIFYRQPRVATGDVFFRREGPATWRGRPLSTALRLRGYDDVAYLDEAEITVSYDFQGFRNPKELKDWELVVVGDSFVELGYLPYDSLYTTILGRLLGLRVKNLGVSLTGPLTHTHYLDKYGRGASTRSALLVFYEGNDVEDLAQEIADLETFRATGKRPFRTIEKQVSFVKAVGELIEGLRRAEPRREGPRLRQDSIFHSSRGEIPVSTASCGTTLRPERAEMLDAALGEWADAVRRQGLTSWLVFMPCKARALAPRLSGLDGTPIQGLDATLIDQVRRLSRSHGMGFIDTTPSLLAESERGVLTFNTIFDNHINEHGSMIVAHAIAMALTEARHDASSLPGAPAADVTARRDN
jgi:hypothetical protein